MLVTPSDMGISTFDDPFLATEIASKTTRSLPRRVLFLLKIWCYEKRQFLMLRERCVTISCPAPGRLADNITLLQTRPHLCDACACPDFASSRCDVNVARYRDRPLRQHACASRSGGRHGVPLGWLHC